MRIKKTTLRYILILILSTSLGVVVSKCSVSEKEKVVPIGPDIPANMVIYFKVGVTEEQIDAFSKGTLSRPDPSGRGYSFRDGIGLQLRVFPPVQGHEAIAITFLAKSTQRQREEVRSAIASSPIVYKIIENIAPADVKKIE